MLGAMSGQTIKDKAKVFRDPVHRLIRIEPDDQFVLDLINTSRPLKNSPAFVDFQKTVDRVRANSGA